MKISKSDQRLLIIFAGIVIFVAAYLGIYNNLNAKADGINAEIAALEPRLNELRGYSDQLSTYQSGIDAIYKSVTEELSGFPGDVRSEDLIMYVTALESSVGMKITQASFTPPEVISQFNIPKSVDGKAALVPVAALKVGLSLSGDLDYLQLKKLIKFIYETPDSTALDSINISFNSETGGLSVAAEISKFFISSEDYAYAATQIPTVPKGTGNPFGTFAVAKPTPSPKP
ncbi:MAG: hypothetical protein RSD32_04180 [Oscillospiraceae bacterium]